MKLSFPISAFNDHAIFSQYLKNFCMKICKKHWEPHIIYLTTEENQSQAISKQFHLLCELQHPKFGVTLRQRSHAKIDIILFVA